jgi:hypothetical protein
MTSKCGFARASTVASTGCGRMQTRASAGADHATSARCAHHEGALAGGGGRQRRAAAPPCGGCRRDVLRGRHRGAAALLLRHHLPHVHPCWLQTWRQLPDIMASRHQFQRNMFTPALASMWTCSNSRDELVAARGFASHTPAAARGAHLRSRCCRRRPWPRRRRRAALPGPRPQRRPGAGQPHAPPPAVSPAATCQPPGPPSHGQPRAQLERPAAATAPGTQHTNRRSDACAEAA